MWGSRKRLCCGGCPSVSLRNELVRIFFKNFACERRLPTSRTTPRGGRFRLSHMSRPKSKKRPASALFLCRCACGAHVLTSWIAQRSETTFRPSARRRRHCKERRGRPLPYAIHVQMNRLLISARKARHASHDRSFGGAWEGCGNGIALAPMARHSSNARALGAPIPWGDPWSDQHPFSNHLSS
jgi:hypothetical protein